MAREGARGRAGPGEEGIGVKFRRGKACEGKEGRREVLGGGRGKNCLARGGVERSFRRSAVSPHRLARSGHHPFTVRTGVRIPVGTPAAPEAWGFRFGTPEGFDGASGASGEGQAAGLGRSPERSESIPVGTPRFSSQGRLGMMPVVGNPLPDGWSARVPLGCVCFRLGLGRHRPRFTPPCSASPAACCHRGQRWRRRLISPPNCLHSIL